MGNKSSVKKKVSVEEKKVQLKVFVDEKKKKVMFAEADEDFVEILFSFFTLPLGTIARLDLLTDKDVGSLSSLYGSVVNLNVKHFFQQGYKNYLVIPKNSSASFCEKLKVNLDGRKPVYSQPDHALMFFKNKAKFIITDDLNIVPLVMDTSIALLNSLGVECIDLLEERTMYFGFREVADNYYCVTDLLPIYEVNTRPGRFLKEQTTFLVSDDMRITASQSVATISNFNPPGVLIGDMELLEMSIGEQEALLLLKASLMSKTALTDCLEAFRKKPKVRVPNIAFAGDGGGDSEEVDFLYK